MATINQFSINGKIDTSVNALDNLNMLANASGCFLTWDPNAGKWVVLLNTTGSSVKTFDDSNIIGEINLGGSGINELYNSVSVRFPNKDIRDTIDVIELEIPSADRFPQELDNTLQLEIPIVNEPVQAQYIASRELKQSRVDKIIEFRANFEANTIRAGDLIDITNAPLGYTNKVFRVIQVDEEDTEEGNIFFAITAQEYDANVYSTAGLTYEFRSNFTGIKSKLLNQELDRQDDISIGGQVGRLLAANAALGLINSLFTVDEETGAIINEGKFADEDIQAAISSVGKPTPIVSATPDPVCTGSDVTFSIRHNCSNCFFKNPQFTYEYTITGIDASEIDIPLTGTLTTTGTAASTIVGNINIQGSNTKTVTFTSEGVSDSVVVYPEPDEYVVEVVSTSNTITEGDTVAVTVNTFGYSDGTTLNYTISGSASSKVTSPALTGTVTLTADTASLSIVTSDDNTFGSSQSLTVKIGDAIVTPCVISDDSVTITVLNNATTGPEPPPDPGDPADDDVFCEFVEVPVVWCGRFDGTNGYLKSVSVRKTAFLPVAPVGGVAVPSSLTITDPGTSSAGITIASTVNVEPAGINAGGQIFDVITSFDPPPSGGDTLLTGTVTRLVGYTQ